MVQIAGEEDSRPLTCFPFHKIPRVWPHIVGVTGITPDLIHTFYLCPQHWKPLRTYIKFEALTEVFYYPHPSWGKMCTDCQTNARWVLGGQVPQFPFGYLTLFLKPERRYLFPQTFIDNVNVNVQVCPNHVPAYLSENALIKFLKQINI
jgi:hypothetical protein